MVVNVLQVSPCGSPDGLASLTEEGCLMLPLSPLPNSASNSLSTGLATSTSLYSPSAEQQQRQSRQLESQDHQQEQQQHSRDVDENDVNNNSSSSSSSSSSNHTNVNNAHGSPLFEPLARSSPSADTASSSVAAAVRTNLSLFTTNNNGPVATRQGDDGDGDFLLGTQTDRSQQQQQLMMQEEEEEKVGGGGVVVVERQTSKEEKDPLNLFDEDW